MHQKCFAPIASSDAPASLRAVMTCGEVTLQTLEGWWSSSNGTWYCIQADVVRACAPREKRFHGRLREPRKNSSGTHHGVLKLSQKNIGSRRERPVTS